MAEEFYFDKILVVSGNMRVEISLERFERQFSEAQQWLGDTVLEDCKAFMPHRTGSMQQRSHVNNRGREVVFPGPYARMQYGGVVMVDSVTGKGPMKIPTGPGGEFVFRYREGAILTPSTRRLTYSSPTATDHWFDAAQAAHGSYWIAEAKRRAGGG
ncbi:MAG: hypothetical protein J6A79_12595 [Clostridia bacterium]|nr:hypothetical protein [Clostridia bacterium]